MRNNLFTELINIISLQNWFKNKRARSKKNETRRREVDDAITEFSFCRVIPVDDGCDDSAPSQDSIDDDIAEFSFCRVIPDVDDTDSMHRDHVTKRLEAVYILEQVPDPELMSLLAVDLDIPVHNLDEWFSRHHTAASFSDDYTVSSSSSDDTTFRPWL